MTNVSKPPGTDLRDSQANAARLRAPATGPDRHRAEWSTLAISMASGCVLLLISVALPRLWAQQPRALADEALRFVLHGWIILLGVFLPLWAGTWTLRLTLALAGGVFVLLAGRVQGSELSTSAGSCAAAVGVACGFSTIWAIASLAGSGRRWAWLLTVVGVLGWPTWCYLRVD